MTGPIEEFDVVVLGAGWRGLSAGLRLRRERSTARLLVLDAAAWPGGSIRTIRTNGFVCELGPFAFAANELDPLCALLDQPPNRIGCEPAARGGSVFTGTTLAPVAVDPTPWSFRSGNEELVQACRRQLGTSLRLGRAVEAIDLDGQFTITLGGEVPSTLRAAAIAVALPEPAAARLLGRFDPALPDVANRLRTTAAAMVFFGGNCTEAPELTGYGIVPAETVATPVREAIFCSEVFARRALPGRFLVRLECEAPAADPDDVIAAVAERELRTWTGTRADLGLRKVHRYDDLVADGALVECRIRLRGLPDRVPGLQLA